MPPLSFRTSPLNLKIIQRALGIVRANKTELQDILGEPIYDVIDTALGEIQFNYGARRTEFIPFAGYDELEGELRPSGDQLPLAYEPGEQPGAKLSGE